MPPADLQTQCSAALDARRGDTHAPPRPPLRRLRDARREIQLPEVPRRVLFDFMLSDAQNDVRRPDGRDEGAAEAGRTGEARRPAAGSRFRRGAIDSIAARAKHSEVFP